MQTRTGNQRLCTLPILVALSLAPVVLWAGESSSGAASATAKDASASSTRLLKQPSATPPPVLKGFSHVAPTPPPIDKSRDKPKPQATGVAASKSVNPKAAQPQLRENPVNRTLQPLQPTRAVSPQKTSPQIASPAKKPGSEPGQGTTDGNGRGTIGSIASPLRMPAISAPSLAAPALGASPGFTRTPGNGLVEPGLDMRLAGLRDTLEGGRMRGQMERAGIGRELQRGSQFNDPLTGDPLMTGQRRYSGYDPALGGRGGNDPLGSGRTSAFSDPLTGRSRFGGDDTGSGGDSKADQVRAAGRFGKGMAMDDDTVTDDTPVFMDLTFSEAYVIAYGQRDGVTIKMDSGTEVTIWSTRDRSTGNEGVLIEYNHSTGHSSTVFWTKGKAPETYERPRPDDDGAAPTPTEAERRQIAEELKNWSNPAARPHPDDDGAPKGGGSVEEALDDVDLAGRPQPDDDGERRSGTPGGTVFTQLGLAGRPVDQDPDFGTLQAGGGGIQPAGGFGAALQRDANTGLKLPRADAAGNLDSRIGVELEHTE